jgi:two-component system OmpR family response regulator
MARVLFVDDDPQTLEIFGKAVGVFGHQALWASDGQAALRIAAEQSPDIIFVDLSLPDMDGMALISRLQQTPGLADIPMLVLSASPELDAAELARKAGARAYLNKPIRLQTLLDTIQTYAGSAG